MNIIKNNNNNNNDVIVSLKSMIAKELVRNGLNRSEIRRLPTDVHDELRKFMSPVKQLQLWPQEHYAKFWDSDSGYYAVFHYIKVSHATPSTIFGATWKREKLWADGYELHGPYFSFYRNGEVRERGYFSCGNTDNLSGYYETYDENGNLTNKGQWKNGEEYFDSDAIDSDEEKY
jgi:hypothetical protein